MSSSDDKELVCGPDFGSECGEQTSGLEASSTAPRGPGPDPGPEPGAPRSGEGEGGDGFPDPEGFESEREVLEAGGPVLLGCEGRPGSPADDTGYALQLSDESLQAIVRQLADLDLRGILRHMSPESQAVGHDRGPRGSAGVGEVRTFRRGRVPPDTASARYSSAGW